MAPIKSRSKSRNFPPMKCSQSKSYLYKPLLVGIYMDLNILLTNKESKHKSHNCMCDSWHIVKIYCVVTSTSSCYPVSFEQSRINYYFLLKIGLTNIKHQWCAKHLWNSGNTKINEIEPWLLEYSEFQWEESLIQFKIIEHYCGNIYITL